MDKPLVVGPLFYGWPKCTDATSVTNGPRFGFGLKSVVAPLAERGWIDTLGKADLVMCATENHAAELRAQLPNKTIIGLPVIVQAPNMASRPICKAMDRTVNLAFVANLVPNKNPLLFLEVVHRLIDSGFKATGVVIGDGIERARLEEYVRSNQLAHAIRFTGKVPNSVVYQHLTSADFLVSMSFGEPYGRSIVEAMSTGTPCVCHRSGGPADFIADGIDGLLIDELSVGSYVSRLRDIATSNTAWNRLSTNAFNKAVSWRSENVLDRLEETLQRLTTVSIVGQS
jgi:glycosyltransferase involved in cell wall biosynthesis